MDDSITIKSIEERYPNVVIDGKVDFEQLAITLLEELGDIQDQMLEKDYQILKITERLDKLGV